MASSTIPARDRLLARIRSGLKATESADGQRRLAVQKRLGQPVIGIIPARSKLQHGELVTAFAERLEAQRATVARLASGAEVPVHIADLLRQQNLPATVRMGADPVLAGLPWATAPTLHLSQGRSHGDDLVGLSRAFAGAAETGTIVLTSGQDNPTTLNFLPDTHIVLIAAADIVGPYEEIWSRLRAQHGARAMPRTVNWVSGPSRTADIEQTMVQGAHGPRRLHVIIVGETG
jgi:L-lactate dehydrogenase complex protein LldG